MGVSTDGILVFGVNLGERGEVDLPWGTDEEDDFEEWFHSLHGLSNTHLWDEYEAWAKTPVATAIAGGSNERVRVYEAAHPAWREALDDLYDRRRETLKEAPIEIVRHCSGDYPMFIVGVPGTLTTAHRGSPEPITTLEVDPQRVEAARAFCAEHDIPFEDPAWLLASMWW